MPFGTSPAASFPACSGLSTSTKPQAPGTLFRSTIARFFFSRAFHAAGGDARDGCWGDVNFRLRGEGEECVCGGDIGARAGGCCWGSDSRSNTGDESSVKSRVSTVGDAEVGFVGSKRGDVRSRISTSAGADMVLLRRGEVRRGPKISFALFFLTEPELADGADRVKPFEAFDDMDVNGGRTTDDAAVSGAAALSLW